MNGDSPGEPVAPNLPKYLREPLEKQSPGHLEMAASYAIEPAEWKRRRRRGKLECRRGGEAVDREELQELEERGVSTDPDEYEDVPNSGAYVTIKETKSGCRYFYWQWREDDSWKNEYIAPVNPK